MPPPDTISKTIGVVTELTVIAPLKEGGAARLRQVLGSLQVNPESPIKQIDTIHFARWVIIDNDTRLLFTSNFDGSLEAYLRDFSIKTPQGMDAIFGNCEGYPAGGCQDFEAFKQYVRCHQVVTDLFYAAYPESTVKAVKKALEVKALADQIIEKLS
ncbi:MAG TPA: hypothetical protein VNP98_15280 [Chthoniobacterales bacterium]|nr:hypothetical protein [Chthoniobacterales bacterium]